MSLRELQASPQAFRDALIIDADGQPARLANRIEGWQRRDFEALDRGWWCAVTGQKHDAVRRAWLERPRGHSKTSDIAIQCCWALFASSRKLSGYGAAASLEQARILRNHIDTLIRLNPWLGQVLTVQNYQVTNRHTGSTLTIVSSDAPTSYGLLPDFVVCDELVHWASSSLWESLLSAAGKRANCLLVIITNAGFGGDESWQWKVREAVRADESWYFSRLDGPVASWITQDRLDEQRRLLPDLAYRRLWLNQWTSGVGDALNEDDISAAITQLGPLSRPEKGWHYFGGLDLSVSSDLAALAVIGRDVGWFEEQPRPQRVLSTAHEAMIDAGIWDEPEEEQPQGLWHPGSNRLKLATLHVWNPRESSTGQVNYSEIEETVFELGRIFRMEVGVDPYQAVFMIQRLQQAMVIQPVHFTGEPLKSMCSATLGAFTERNLDLYPHPQLLTDLRNLRIEEKRYGIRLVSPHGPNGHGDCATALSIGLHVAKTRTGLAHFSDDRKLVCYP